MNLQLPYPLPSNHRFPIPVANAPIFLFATSHQENPQKGTDKSKPAAVLSIILADDDSDDRELFLEAISESGLQVKVDLAEDGCKLIDFLESSKSMPDLIFLDLNMPNKNGKECLEELRQKEKYHHIPIIIYSTSSSAKDIDDTYAKGANLYVRKPSSFHELLNVTKQVLMLDWEHYKPRASKSNFVFPVKHL